MHTRNSHFFTIPPQFQKALPNDNCPCPSGKKFKNCCRDMLKPVERDIAIIVGAGASCEHSLCQECPPLGNDLGEKLRQFTKDKSGLHFSFDEVEKKAGLISNKDFTCGEDFEFWLNELAQLKSTDELPDGFTKTMWLMAKYFAQFGQVHESSTYLKLLQKIKPHIMKRIFFISINYETLLEQALVQCGFGAKSCFNNGEKNYFSSSFSWKNIPVYKPHGSCNFITPKLSMFGVARVLGHVFNPNTTYSIGGDSVHSEDLGYVRSLDPRSMQVLPPIMSAYMPGKDTPIARERMNQMRNELMTTMKSVRHLFAIGVGYRETEKYINAVIQEPLNLGANFYYVGDENHYKGFCAEAKRASDKPVGLKFGESVDELIRRINAVV